MNNQFRTTTILLATVAVISLTNASQCHAGILKSLANGARSVAGKLFGESAEAGSKSASRAIVRQTDDAGRLLMKNADETAAGVVKVSDDLAGAGTKSAANLFRPGGMADDAAGFVSRNKTAVATAAVATAVVANPEAVLGAATDVTVGLASVAGESIARPVIEQAGNAIAPMVPQIIINLMWIVFAGIMIWLAVSARRLRRDVSAQTKECEELVRTFMARRNVASQKPAPTTLNQSLPSKRE